MTPMPVGLTEAKDSLSDSLREFDWYTGCGIGFNENHDYVIKVLVLTLEAETKVPMTWQGWPVNVEVTGRAVAR